MGRASRLARRGPSARRLMVTAGVALAALWLATSGAPVAEAAPSISLSPNSGDAPSEDGEVLGAGWLCEGGGAPVGAASVTSGRTILGSATINRDGTLRGTFSVSGSAGEAIHVQVSASSPCPTIGPPVYLQATATFTFNAADTPTPRPTLTATPAPATETPTAAAPATPTPTAAGPPPPPPSPVSSAAPPEPTVAPGASATPSAPSSPTATATAANAPVAPGSDANTVTFAGCVPDGALEFTFTPLFLLGTDLPNSDPSGPTVRVRARPVGSTPRTFAFDPPSGEPLRLFRVDVPAGGTCAIDEQAPTYWVAGQSLVFPTGLTGATTLEVCALGDVTPCDYPVVKGAFVQPGGTPYAVEADGTPTGTAWVTEKAYYLKDLKSKKQRFRWETSAEVAGGQLQASIVPFAKTGEDDPLAPQGLVATWDIPCVDCEFTVQLSALAPEEPPAKQAWYEKAWEWIIKPFQVVFGAIGDVFVSIGHWVGIGDDGGGETAQAKAVNKQAQGPGDYLVDGSNAVPFHPTTFYFRIMPMSQASAGGAPSGTVRFQQVDEPDPIKIVSTPTPAPANSPYSVEIVSYHGIIPPQVPNNSCYIVTQDAWPKPFPPFTYTTDKAQALGGAAAVKAGTPICPPKPKEPSLLEQIVSWAETTVNWASEAWSDLKSFAVDVMLKYTPFGLQCAAVESAGVIPDGGCNAAFTIALDAALVSLGVPPDLPNFDQLMDEGITYVAAQAAAQVAIPPEVVQAAVEQGGPLAGLALDVAEAKLREELEASIKANMENAVKSIQLGYAASVAWIPDGIPVRPDDYQPPAAVVRVTRKTGVAGGDAGCMLEIRSNVQLPSAAVNNPSPEWASFVNGLPHPLSSLTLYDFFANEGGEPGFPSEADKSLPVQPLAPGESVAVPMTFKPNYYKSGWSPLGTISTSDYIGVWQYLHEFGTLRLSASGCGSDTLETPAKAILLGAETAPP